MSDEKSLKTVATVVYALHVAGFFTGIAWIVAIVVDYVKKDDAKGTWLESHFTWQIRITTLILVGFAILFAAAVWIIYRIAKGWLSLAENKPVGI